MFGGQNVMQIFSTSKMYKLCWASSRATLVFNQKCAAEHPGLHLWQAWAIPHQAAADWWRETPQSHKTEIFYTTSTATLIQYSCATMNAAGSAPQGSSSPFIAVRHGHRCRCCCTDGAETRCSGKMWRPARVRQHLEAHVDVLCKKTEWRWRRQRRRSWRCRGEVSRVGWEPGAYTHTVCSLR